MTTPTITWRISQLDCKPIDGNHNDVVVTAHWQCVGELVDGDNTFNGSVINVANFSSPSGEFTPYADLTESQVLGWIWANGVDKDATESAVAAQIEAKINPPIVQPALPWAQEGVEV